jgi:hypothetical protein
MVYGNLNSMSCTGKMVTRNPDTGENVLFGKCYTFILFYIAIMFKLMKGEFLCDACGDDLAEKSEWAVHRLNVCRYAVPHVPSLLLLS